MTYNREAHEALEETLKEMVAKHGSSTAYARMVGYLMVNSNRETAERIARHESDKKVGA
jgi:hypothetical protein